ncbi:hypothetical protein [Streptomyces axinellae]|uniref:hypothetical protein n=1 Tax=Streptomyces axinellae TaxID=552788 RepID=UPI0031E0A8B8
MNLTCTDAAQRAWHRTDAALASPAPADPSALRRRLLLLSTRIWWHPAGDAPSSVGRGPGTAALRRHVRDERSRGAVGWTT